MRRFSLIAVLAVLAVVASVGASPAAAVPVYGGVSGSVMASNGSHPSGVGINLVAIKGGESHYTLSTDGIGHFSTNDVVPGTYWVFSVYSIGDDVWQQYFEDADGRIPVVVEAGFQTTGVNIVLELAGTITGKVLYDSSVAAWTPPPSGIPPTFMQALRFDPDTGLATQVGGSMSHNADGTFTMSQLPPGEYTIRYIDIDAEFFHTAPRVTTEYYGEAEWLSDATTFTVTAGTTVTLADETMSLGAAPEPIVDRLDGLDRFEAAVSFSQVAVATGDDVPVVYIVNGLNFADALSAGPAAAFEGGVLLLVQPTFIPTSTHDELLRLDPDRIEIVGGPASVSESVKSQLNAIAPTTRIGGETRFDVSRAVAEKAFGPFVVQQAFIVTGYNYPDALSAGSIASIYGAPVILVASGSGNDGPLDSATRQVLVDLGVERVHIVGGPGSVSPAIEQGLIAMPSLALVDRFGGADRYAASAALAAAFPQDDIRFLATGANFPDALAGSWLAGRSGGAVILIPGSCIPAETATLLATIKYMVILGGPASVTPAVETRTVC